MINSGVTQTGAFDPSGGAFYRWAAAFGVFSHPGKPFGNSRGLVSQPYPARSTFSDLHPHPNGSLYPHCYPAAADPAHANSHTHPYSDQHGSATLTDTATAAY